MSGKSHLSKHFARNYSTVFFDVLNEHSGEFDSYVPKFKAYPQIADEFDLFISKVCKIAKYNMIVVDEASRVFPNKIPFKPQMRNFIDVYRHHGKGIGFICRRPVQLNTDLVELSHYIFIFNLKGKNDVAYFNSIATGLGDRLPTLEQYQFVVVYPDRHWEVCNPI